MFITIDGPDGVGKTTIAKALVDAINETGGHKKAIYTSEPTSSELGTQIREILRSPKNEDTARLTELFVEDRANHISDISSWLENDKIVICDRYKYSTIVYQQLQGEGIERLLDLNSKFMDPDYAFVLNVKNVDTLLSHISDRGLDRDLFETSLTLKEAIRLYNNVGTYYKNVIYIDAEQTFENTLSSILGYLGAF